MDLPMCGCRTELKVTRWSQREIQRSLPKEAAKELKGTRWLWLTNPENLTPEQQASLVSRKRS